MVQLYTDHYFHIGNTHLTGGKPCQDYAISDVCNNAALAIISDGCSTGGHTDVGARILALSTATAIREHWIINQKAFSETIPLEISLNQKIVMTGTRQSLGLQLYDMLATCAYAYISPLGGFVHIQGDGVVALKYQDEHIVMSRFDWDNNMPYYPAYSEDGLVNFIKEHGNNLNALRLNEEKRIQYADGKLSEPDIKRYTLSDGIRGITINISAETLSKLTFIAVFSDGVTQIDRLDWKNAVSKFMTFKNFAGEFAKRRMIRKIKDVQKIGKGPIDDIAYAVVRVEQMEIEEGNHE
ncbi:protein phosphatase 2C domain-containing protein [Patescibacteria group bacterium]|nr:protein phosphatase 2C domain-containing protein [Patescibacteria group bacterium]MBU0879529.1 protein phosphatase 2C domain-containing protein [Patescibacteria group bacterium]MBU0880390.1 protein phosphatase 2C domain-containing protein [Patescibacteria group bacterium]MBU0897772.1 protein phosphatase 2C domain-containing protein [Patescibacteria group bacterium]MBU1783252.1 protein phosphatase 2C domain-containing protein [Patescibacteria group bacterium]